MTDRVSALVRAGLGLACALLVGWSGGALAGDEQAQARALLEEMARATRELNYDGVFVYQRGNRTDSMRIIHRADGQDERERLVSLTGPPREVIRDHETVTCIYPETKAVMVEKSRPRALFPGAFAGSLDDLSGSYVLALLGADRVAGRDTTTVAIRPKVPFRYGYTLWLDRETRLLLRSSVVDVSGNVLEETMFTEIDFPETIADDLLEPSVVGEGFTWHTSAAAEPQSSTDDGSWQVDWLPDGFSLSDFRVEPMAASAQPVRHLSYTDGLAMISVFVEPFEPAKEAMQGFSSLGAVSTFSLRSGEHQITVVGDVPPLAVRQVATSVRHAQAK